MSNIPTIEIERSEPDKASRESVSAMLMEHYGIDTVSGLPMWRIAWSNDQYENRLGEYDDYTESGIFIRTVREVRLVPKYSQWINAKYVLEHLEVVPFQNAFELPQTKISYEPKYVFENGKGEYLPLNPIVARIQVEYFELAKAMARPNERKYKDPEAENNGLIARANRIKKLMNELYGDESGLDGAIVHGEGVAGFYPEGKASKVN